MDPETREKITALNTQFYQSFAQAFSETRGRLQPGVKKILAAFPEADQVLDLGCGNGQITREIARQGLDIHYLGADFSPALLAEAKRRLPSEVKGSFQRLDLTRPDWEQQLPPRKFDVILCFATLHHLPGRDLRRQVCLKIRALLQREGFFIHSNWQFLKSPRLRKRILPWSTVGIPAEKVEEGDYLVDWRRGGTGIRYVHAFSKEELAALAEESGFTIQSAFYSDGKEGNLSLYQTWRPTQD